MRGLRVSLMVALLATVASATDWRCFTPLLLFSEQRSGLPLIVSRRSMSRQARERIQFRTDALKRYQQMFNPEFPFRAELVPTHDTIRVYSRAGRISSETEVAVLVLHEMGWQTSGHELMREMVRTLSVNNPIGDSPEAATARYLQQSLGPERVRASVELIDMPGHGLGPPGADYDSVKKTVEWLRRYIRNMKRSAPDIPVVVLGWGASAPVAKALTEAHPSLVDATVYLAPLEGGMPRYDLADELRAVCLRSLTIPGPQAATMQARVEPNPEGISYFTRVVSQVSPFTPVSLKQGPTLILFGNGDRSVPGKTAELFQREAEGGFNLAPCLDNRILRFLRKDDYWYLELNSSSHEPFCNYGTPHPYQLSAYQALDMFLRHYFRKP